jgi:hypothetical protein
MSVDHSNFILSVNNRIKLSINQFTLLEYFHATCFIPLQQNVSMFFTDLHNTMDLLLIVLSYKKGSHIFSKGLFFLLDVLHIEKRALY